MTELSEWGTLLFLIFLPAASGLFAAFATWAVSRFASLPAATPFVTGAAATLLTWLWIIRRIIDALWPQKEKSLKPVEYNYRVEMAYNEGRTLRFADLPATPQQVDTLATGLTEGKSFTEAAWCSGINKTFTRAEFVQLRDEMIARGLAYWKTPGVPQRGVGLTRAGWHVLERIADEIGDF